MTERKWTPGPWDWDQFGVLKNPLSGRTIEVAGLGLAHFSRGDGGPEAKANAHLIAAAPELFDALESGEALIAGDLVGSEWKQACRAFLKDARAAIAKAEAAQ